MINFKKFGIDSGGRTSGRLKTHCPQCLESRKNKRDKPLSVDLDTGLFNCHYCGFKGSAAQSSQSQQPWQSRIQTRVQPPWAKGAATTSTAPPSKPQQPLAPLTEEHAEWFAHTRGIPLSALTALGVSSGQEYMPQTGKKEACICFHYFEGGERVNTKYRDGSKNFKMLTGAELIPYNVDAIAHTPECIITEGEIDALTFATIGRMDVISVPGGANRNLTWMDRFVASHFDNKQVIYLAVDSDTKGQELCKELLRRLGRERCRVVAYGDGCKDANEQLLKYGTHSLIDALEQAPQTPLEGVYSAIDVAEEMRTLFENGLAGGADTGLENLDKLCTFETGRLCVVTGIPGCGKSEFVDELVLRLGLRHGWRTAFFSPENVPLPYHLRKLAEKLTGHHFKERFMPEGLYNASLHWLDQNMVSILPKEDFTASTVLSKARELVSRRGIRVLVVDPFNRLEHQIPAGQTETQYISSFIDGLTNFAQRNQCLVILVAHPRKMNRDPGQLREPVPTLYDINGSAAFFNKCDFGLVIERDRQAGVTRVHVSKVKFRHLGAPGTASFVYNTTNGRYSPCQEDAQAPREQDRVSHVLFDGESWVEAVK